MTRDADQGDGPATAVAVRGSRLKTWTSAAVTLLVVGAGCFTLWYRGVYNVFPGQGASSRVHWCGRDYEYEGTLTRQQASSQAQWPLQAEGSYPPLALSRDALLAAIYPGGQKVSTSCATLVFLRTGPDSYKLYSLEGGP